MPDKFRDKAYPGAIAALVLGLWLAWLWTPERQVRLHSEHFVATIEKRDWSGAADFISQSYSDDWGHDRSRLLERTRGVLQLVQNLRLTVQEPVTLTGSQEGTWRARISIRAEGEFGPQLEERVNSAGEPFLLTWRLESRKPWDWKLVRVSNPSLEIPQEAF